MSRQAQHDAQNTYNAQNAASKLYGANAAAAYSQLMPQYTNMALNPEGLSPTDKASMNTASMQSSGGSTAGAVTQGNLQAARTGNTGAYQTSLSEAVRRGMQESGDNALKTDLVDTGLKEQQRQEGLSGLSGLYNSNLGASTGELNAENQSTQALTQAGQSGWLQNMTGIMGAVGSVGSAAGSMGFKPFCWVASELYGGWYTPKTVAIRSYVLTRKGVIGHAFRWSYQTFGERWAEAIKVHPTLRKVTQLVFDWMYRKAVNNG